MKRIFPLIFATVLLGQCTADDQTRSSVRKAVQNPAHPDTMIADGKPHHLDAEEISGQDFGSALIQKKIYTPEADQSRTEPTEPGSLSGSTAKSGISRSVHLKAIVDLNEPGNRKNYLQPVENQKFSSLITVSREKFLKINFDNDILDYTDRFYTNGIRIDFINPAFQYFPLSRLMIPYWSSGINYYGLALVQNMYTPSTTKVEGILYGDRPYSAYLYLGTYKITNDPARRVRTKSELDIGVIGSYSLGEYVQKSFHSEVPTNTVPLGWEYQIKNDLVLDYCYSIEKGVVSGNGFDFILNGAGSIGTLYSNISGGFMLKTGIQNPYFANLGVQKHKFNKEQNLRDFQFSFFITSRGKLVGYDATLQGGMINNTSIYTIPSGNVSRVVFEGSAGMTLVYRGVRLDMEQYLLSPEFHDGWWHKWVHLAFTFAL